MADCIDKEAVLDYIRYKVCQGEGNIEHRCNRGSCAYCGICEIMCDISSMPAADVQSIKHGWWIEEEPRVLKCSVCGEYAPMNYLGQNCIDSRYCPWCGTKMNSNADEPWQSE